MKYITIDELTIQECQTSHEAIDYLFRLLDQEASPSHTRQILNQLERLIFAEEEATK